MRRIYLLLAALAICAPAHATTISGSMSFDIFATEFGDDPFGSGFVELRRNHIRDFEFTAFGYTWDEAEAEPCQCSSQFPDILLTIALHGGDEIGSFVLAFDFLHSNFGLVFDDADHSFSGTSENGTAGALLTSFNIRVVSEPGAIGLLALGLVGLLVVRQGPRSN